MKLYSYKQGHKTPPYLLASSLYSSADAPGKKRLPPRQPPDSHTSNDALPAFVVHPYLHLFRLLLITGDLGRLVDVEQAADDTDDDARLPEGNVEGVEEGD